jgi:glutamine synthetase adenylyltransferase
VLTVLEAVLGRTAYLACCRASGRLHQLVTAVRQEPLVRASAPPHPLLLDELLDPRRLFEPLRRATWSKSWTCCSAASTATIWSSAWSACVSSPRATCCAPPPRTSPA